MDRQSFEEQLLSYEPFSDAEKQYRDKFLLLLRVPKAYSRESLEAHFTASAWVIDQRANKVLLLHHTKLDRWLQPGGHADGDENLLRVALRELEEETGITNVSYSKEIFDIDIHKIPARKEVPEHYHYDVRFLFISNGNEFDLKRNEESLDVKWFDLDEVSSITNGEVSIQRMVEKMKIRVV